MGGGRTAGGTGIGAPDGVIRTSTLQDAPEALPDGLGGPAAPSTPAAEKQRARYRPLRVPVIKEDNE